MKRNIILKALMAAVFSTAALQVQAQGIYVNKKNGESIAYPAATFDKVTPEVFSNVQPTKVKGAVANLQYERIADMSTAREGHQIFPSGNGIVVVGGCDVNYSPLQSAEIYQNGQWKNISIGSAHAYGFSAVLSDGRVMVGGGRLSSANDGNYSKKTAIYNPSTQTFTAGPDMTTGRMNCSAIAVGNTVYVNGNYAKGDDKTMDYYNGTSFKAVGNTYERQSPAIFASKSGLIWTWGVYDTSGQEAELYTNNEGKKGMLFNTYTPSTGETDNYYSTDFATNKPLSPTWEMRPSDSFNSTEGDEGYFFLTKDSEGKYLLKQTYESDKNPGATTTATYHLDIPTVFPNTQTSLNYKGSVFVNTEQKEVYLIGYDNNASSGIIYILSYNFTNGYWTIAKAEGLACSVIYGAWCMLPDGRLACTGGYGQNSDIQKCAYIFTPPVAGLTSSAEGKGVNVWKTDGTHDSYTEYELESITTYEEDFDERITQEIPTEYLSKMSAYMPIFSGSTPPNIEGIYNMSVQVMVHNSDVESSYQAGRTFADGISEFTNQNMSANTVQYRYEERSTDTNEVVSTSAAEEAKVLGQGTTFTTFTIVKSTNNDGAWTKMATILSGTMTSSGIKDFYRGILMLDKYDPNDNIMNVGDFRIFKDQDGLSEPTTWMTRQRSARQMDVNTIIQSLPSTIVASPTGLKTKSYINEKVGK